MPDHTAHDTDAAAGSTPEPLTASSFRIAFECAPLGMLLLRGPVVVVCNRALCDLFEQAESQLVGARFETLFPDGESLDAVHARVEQALRDGGRYRETRLVRHVDDGCGDRLAAPQQVQLQYAALDGSPQLLLCSVEALSVPLLDHGKLTSREREVASLLRERYTAKEIGRSLGISHRTVEIYRTRLMKKYGVRNAASLIRLLLREPDEPDMSEPAAGSPGMAGIPLSAPTTPGIRLQPVERSTLSVPRPPLGRHAPGEVAHAF